MIVIKVLAGACAVGAVICFFIGAILRGKELLSKVRRFQRNDG